VFPGQPHIATGAREGRGTSNPCWVPPESPGAWPTPTAATGHHNRNTPTCPTSRFDSTTTGLPLTVIISVALRVITVRRDPQRLHAGPFVYPETVRLTAPTKKYQILPR
jgi:hypothetical protein